MELARAMAFAKRGRGDIRQADLIRLDVGLMLGNKTKGPLNPLVGEDRINAAAH